MKVVLVKNNDNLFFVNKRFSGYKFIPRRENIPSLIMINDNLIKGIINKKLDRTINKLDKIINLIISSNFTLVEDCNMMENEIKKVIKLIEIKYLKYITELEFFDYIKRVYVLNMALNLKKRMVENI